eukprot:scaffold106780_cov29-Prasinocladus_malaysianus.AAC.1
MYMHPLRVTPWHMPLLCVEAHMVILYASIATRQLLQCEHGLPVFVRQLSQSALYCITQS